MRVGKQRIRKPRTRRGTGCSGIRQLIQHLLEPPALRHAVIADFARFARQIDINTHKVCREAGKQPDR